SRHACRMPLVMSMNRTCVTVGLLETLKAASERQLYTTHPAQFLSTETFCRRQFQYMDGGKVTPIVKRVRIKGDTVRL
ncbi:MAG: hypothetical protein JXB07_15115, partial [Anaerolineae bacterium]|nr:hypothetical protein [Anaerolineae bacterium]